jgi:hypothetical protein
VSVRQRTSLRDLLRLASVTAPPLESTHHLVALAERASEAHRQGKVEAAEQLCLEVLEAAAAISA